MPNWEKHFHALLDKLETQLSPVKTGGRNKQLLALRKRMGQLPDSPHAARLFKFASATINLDFFILWDDCVDLVWELFDEGDREIQSSIIASYLNAGKKKNLPHFIDASTEVWQRAGAKISINTSIFKVLPRLVETRNFGIVVPFLSGMGSSKGTSDDSIEYFAQVLLRAPENDFGMEALAKVLTELKHQEQCNQLAQAREQLFKDSGSLEKLLKDLKYEEVNYLARTYLSAVRDPSNHQFTEYLYSLFIKQANHIDTLLRVPEPVLMRHLDWIGTWPMRAELLGKLSDAAAKKAFEHYNWNGSFPPEFPFAKMVRLIEDPAQIKKMVEVVIYESYNDSEPVLDTLRAAPWKYIVSNLAGHDRALDKAKKQFEEISQKLTSVKTQQQFNDMDEPSQKLLLAPISEPSVEGVAKSIDHLPTEVLFAAICVPELRQKLIQAIKLGEAQSGRRLNFFPEDFVAEVRKAVNPWNKLVLTDAFSDLELDLGESSPFKAHRVLFQLDPILKPFLNDDGTVKELDSAAKLRIRWFYGKTACLAPQGQKMLKENRKNPISVASLLNDEKTSDLTLVVEGQEIKVHKFILAASFPLQTDQKRLEIPGLYKDVFAKIQAVYAGKSASIA